MCWYGSHSYLNEFIEEYKCKLIMEIGVYNAKNAETMIKTALKNHRANEIEYFGFDFFYNYSIELIRSKLEPFGCKFNLIKGNTLETIPEVVKFLPKMDIIFIDGGKSYMEAHNDWQGSSVLMHKATGVFVHNAGFFGVGRMVEEIPKEKYVVDLLYPRFEGKVARIMLRS